jgi:Winged helix DNA-binding domain
VVTPGQIAGFRIQRHHLWEDRAADVVSVSRDVCGFQAQILSAAFLQAWARNHSISRSEIEDALWKKRTLIRTSLMRQTLHLVPTDQFPIYIAALRSSRVAGALRIMRRFAISDEEAAHLTQLIMEVLFQGPQTRGPIRDAVRPKVSKRVRAWMDKVWSIVRLPIAEGLICYGSGEGNEVRFVRSDQWVATKSLRIPEEQARAELLRCYLRAYGPATLKDFAHWAGLPAGEVRPLPSFLAADLEEIKIETSACFLLREDLDALTSATGETNTVRLLPHFDPYLLAHREKDHLVSARHYKRVYRNQGWISPVVLTNGSVTGIWRHEVQSRKLRVTVEPFAKLSRAAREGVAREAADLAKFFDSTLELVVL